MEDNKLQILAEHYRDSFALLQDKLKQRDKLFISVLFVLIILLFQLYFPQEALKIISQFISDSLKIKTQIDLRFIESIIWFILLAISLKYFQNVVYIERQYKYMHQLEDQICGEFNNQAFTREGLSYLRNYPILLSWASFLYTIFFPILFIIIVTYKIFGELKSSGADSILFWFNGLICIFIIITTMLYLAVMHFKRN